MLDGTSSTAAHAAQNAALILLSLVFLPLDAIIVAISYVLHSLTNAPRAARGTSRPQTILITGVGMAKALTLARLFHASGHRVIGADFEVHAPSPGRFSSSLASFYRLPKPSAGPIAARYFQSLLDIFLKEQVDLWVSCSGVASAVEDGQAKEIVEARTRCKAVQFDVETTQLLHEKHTFIEHTRKIGLNSPETHTITSRQDVDSALAKAPAGRKFIMKTIGMNDQERGNMNLLPMKNPQATKAFLDRLQISEQNSWILQQFIAGSEFCTHALVVRGTVKAFVACPSSELLMHYKVLPSSSPLSQAMYRFTEQYASAAGESFTGHLSFDFLVEDVSPTTSEAVVLYPIECNPRAHTAVALFNNTPELVEAYLSLLGSNKKQSAGVVVPAEPNKEYYWVGHDLVAFVLYPLLQILLFRTSLSDFWDGLQVFITHFLTCKDGTFDVSDPLPWFALYHIYWPLVFLTCIRDNKKWSRVNVSTLKMFEC